MNYEDIIKAWQKNPIEDTGDIDLKLRNFRILFAYHSCKIENSLINYNDTRDIFESGMISDYSGDIKTLIEQQNHKDCYEMIKAYLGNMKPITLDLINDIHFELNKGLYGESYLAACSGLGKIKQDAEYDLSKLIEEVNLYEGPDILKAAAFFVAGIEHIKPFAYGNGRVARTLINYYLIGNNHPPVIVFEENKKDYNKSLEAFEKNEDLDTLVAFLVCQLEKTWSR